MLKNQIKATKVPWSCHSLKKSCPGHFSVAISKSEMLLILFFVFSILALSDAYIQELSLFAGADQTGNGLTLRTKIADLSAVLKPHIPQVKSYCYQGHWVFYENKNYGGSIVGPYDNRPCVNVESNTWPVDSVRFLGPEDTDIESLSVYESRDYFNREVVITETAANLPLFPPGSLIVNNGLSRLANWTLFSELNYAGDSVCLVTEKKSQQVNVLKTVFPAGIKSVAKGCNERVLGYVTVDALESI